MNYTTFDDLFSRTQYPAGERHIRQVGLVPAAILGAAERPVIEATVRNFEDLGALLTADRILKRNRVQATWFVPYFPFARQERRLDELDGSELELALDLVRTLDITIVDPHSEVAGMLPHIPQDGSVALFERAGLFAEDALVVIPDAGAAKKVYSWLDGRDSIQCSKRRDPKTGALSGFQVPHVDLAGRPCVIVDDICDGGGTFIGLAKELAKRGAGPMRLGVTHGLFTKGFEELNEHFSHIVGFAPTGTTERAAFHALPYQLLYANGGYACSRH